TTIYTTRFSARLASIFHKMNIQPKPYPLYDELPPEPLLKALFIGEAEEIERVKTFVKSNETETLNFVQSSQIFYEVIPSGVSKWSGISTLLEQLQLQSHHCAAIGDHLNDLSMIQEAGLAVTLDN